MNDDVPYPRFASQGRAFVYLLPCRDDTLLKIGFSRDPVQRLLTLHSRFFDFFELENALLVEADFVQDARRIERHLLRTFKADQAPAPIVVSATAGGHTEWYRGVYADAVRCVHELCARDGFVLHAPLSGWLRERFVDSASLLYSWSAWLLEAVQYERYNVPKPLQTGDAARALRRVLDAYASLQIDLSPLLPRGVRDWYFEAQCDA
jgi:hypothetical protein